MSIFVRRYEKNIIFRLSKVFNSTSTSNQTDTETNTTKGVALLYC